MEEAEIKNIVSKTLVENMGTSNPRIERKILNILHERDFDSETIEKMLIDFVEPMKAKYISRYIITNLSRKESLLEYLKNLNAYTNNESSLKSSDDSLQRLKHLQMIQNQINKKVSSIASLKNSQVDSLPNNKSDAVVTSGVFMKPKPTLLVNKRMLQDQGFRSKSSNFELSKIIDIKDVAPLKYQDERLNNNNNNVIRMKRGIEFIDNDKLLSEISIKEKQKKLKDLNRKISETASKTGIADAARISYLSSKSEFLKNEIPTIEWWHRLILNNDNNADINNVIRENEDNNVIIDYNINSNMPIDDLNKENIENICKLSNIIIRPIALKPSNRATNPKSIKLNPTTQELRRLRRQTRREAQKEEQEKIKLGLIEPPAPKVKIANLMTVLTDDAIQDPTKMEAFVREQTRKRLDKHLKENEKRKLTKDQKSEKIKKKNRGSTEEGLFCLLFKIKRLFNPSWRFKIEKNAEQLNLSGKCAITKTISVLVVEGAEKQIKKYKQLLMRRIDFDNKEQQSINSRRIENVEYVTNNCTLVWEGKIRQRCFKEFQQDFFNSEMAAREAFRVLAVEHYWDLALGYDLNTINDAEDYDNDEDIENNNNNNNNN